jgi:hypothetical protein
VILEMNNFVNLQLASINMYRVLNNILKSWVKPYLVLFVLNFFMFLNCFYILMIKIKFKK